MRWNSASAACGLRSCLTRATYWIRRNFPSCRTCALRYEQYCLALQPLTDAAGSVMGTGFPISANHVMTNQHGGRRSGYWT